MLLGYTQLLDLVRDGVIENGREDAINSASIDIHLGNMLLIEPYTEHDIIIDYSKRERPRMTTVQMNDNGYVLRPGQFVLAQSVEVFNLPDHISGEYKLKSSMARIGLEHLNAGWCDAGWHGSVLTLELKNMLNNYSIRIRPGDAIGQIVFFCHDPVPKDKSYAARGRYNNEKTAATIKE